MTRKDYKLIAEVVKDNYEHAIKHKKHNPTPNFVIELLVSDLANALVVDNPKFLYNRFYEACGLDLDRMSRL